MGVTRTHAIGIGLLALAGSIGAYSVLQAPEALPQGAGLTAERDVDDAPARRDEDRDPRELATKLESLSAEVEALRALVAQQRAREQRDSAKQDDFPGQEEQHELWEEHVSYAEAGFNNEKTDARWASATGTLIQNQIATQPALRGATQALECRSKSCRLELRDDGSEAFARELPTLVHELGPQMSSVIVDLVQDGQGRRTQVLYMSRAEPTKTARAERSL